MKLLDSLTFKDMDSSRTDLPMLKLMDRVVLILHDLGLCSLRFIKIHRNLS